MLRASDSAGGSCRGQLQGAATMVVEPAWQLHEALPSSMPTKAAAPALRRPAPPHRLPLQELLRCVAASKPRYVYTARQRISCQHPGALGRRQLALHPSFAKSLRMGMADLRRLAASLTRAPGSAAPTAGGGQLADSRKAGRGGGGRRRAAGRPAAGVGGGSVSSDAGAAAASSSSGAAAAASVAVPLGPDSTLYYSPCFWNAEPAAAQAVQA